MLHMKPNNTETYTLIAIVAIAFIGLMISGA